MLTAIHSKNFESSTSKKSREADETDETSSEQRKQQETLEFLENAQDGVPGAAARMIATDSIRRRCAVLSSRQANEKS